jgi:hypothetical protein
MTKSSTLENVLSKSEAASSQLTRFRIPEREGLTMIIRYSMALQVCKTNRTGNQYLILN